MRYEEPAASVLRNLMQRGCTEPCADRAGCGCFAEVLIALQAADDAGRTAESQGTVQ